MHRTLFLAFLILAAPAGLAPAAAQFSLPAPAAEPEATETAAPAKVSPEAVEALIQLLGDPAARDALIETLRERSATDPAAGEPAAGEPEPAASAAAEAEGETFAQRIGAASKEAAEAASGFVVEVIAVAGNLGQAATGARPFEWQPVLEAIARLAIVVVATFSVFYILRLIATRPFGALERRAERGGIASRIIASVAAGLIDLAVILIAWAAGYVVALSTGNFGQIRLQSTFFLNAFLLIEATKVGVRFLLAPRFERLRVLPLSDLAANYWCFWIARLIGFAGYGILLVVPFVSTTISPVVGAGLRVLIVLTAAVIAVVIILQNKTKVALGLRTYGASLRGATARRMFHVIAGLWHLAAIAYVLMLVAVWLLRPEDAVTTILGATAQSAVIVGIGMVVMGVIRRAATGGMRLPPDLRARLPLLESQLNSFVPRVLKIVQIVILIAVVLALLQAWQVWDMLDWLDSPTGRIVVARLFGLAVVLILAATLWMAVSSWIDYRLNPDFGTVPSARERTLLALFRNAAMVTIIAVGAMLALSEIGVNIGPLLAGAGVVGLAIGFGAQKMVQDIITGVFIQFENAINEGDVITVAGTTGVVERLTIRSVGIRSLDGIYHIVPFSSVDTVSNYMRGFSYHVAEIGVAYRENIAEVKALMHQAFEQLKAGEHGSVIVGPLEMHGVTAFADSAVVVRARIKTLPGQQFASGRAYNEIVKEVFDAAGIEIPFPHVTIYMGEDKGGKAPPLRLRRSQPPATEKDDDADAPAMAEAEPAR